MEREEGSRGETSRRRPWRALAACAWPALLALWALGRGVLVLGATGLRRSGEAGATREWALLAVGSTVVVALLWARSRALRVFACTLHALQLSVAFGVAGVTGVMYAFGGPDGTLEAPGWALVGLVFFAAWTVASLLASAALVVAEVRAGDAAEEGRNE